MSVHSNYTISRDIAIQVILSAIHKADDDVLEEMLDCLSESIYRNYRVTNYPYLGEEKNINSVEDFYSDK